MVRPVCRVMLCAVAVLPVVGMGAAPSRPTVVELYTSEGCSSCPPAEAQIGQLAKQDNILALAFHVQYWDDLGWRDRFGMPEALVRQRQYAHTLHLPSIYTPQLVIDGQRDRVGGGESIGLAAWGAGGGKAGVPLDISVHADSLVITLGAQTRQAPCDVLLLSYLSEATSKVTRGENVGRELHEFNVVRRMRLLGSWQGDSKTFTVPLNTVAPDATAVAVLVQRQGQGPIIGAASRSLR